MRAIVLVAGRSSRLRRAGINIPKHLIPFYKTPYIYYILKNLKKSGIKEIGIVIAKDDKRTPQLLGNGKKLGLLIRYFVQSSHSGTGMAIKCARKFVKGEKFLVQLGSDIFEKDFKKEICIFEKNSFDAMVTVYKAKDIHLHGMAFIKKGKLKKVIEKPKKAVSNWVLTGCYFFGNKIFDAVDITNKSELPLNRGEIVITDVIQTMIESGANVHALKYLGKWEALRIKKSMERIASLIMKSGLI